MRDTTRLRPFLKADSFAPRPTVCLCLCPSCPFCSCSCCCMSCRVLLHLASSNISPSVPFYHSSCTCCCLCRLCEFLDGFWCLLASCCHYPYLFHFQLTRSGLLQSFGKNDTNATKLSEERDALQMCRLHTVPKKIGAIFITILIITVHLTASARTVPDARSQSPTSSSPALKTD